LPLPASVSASEVWDATLAQLLLQVSPHTYENWLKDTAGLRFEGTTLVVRAPSDLARDWLSSRLRAMVLKCLTAAAGPGLSLRFEAAQDGAAIADSDTALQPPLIPAPSFPLNARFSFATFFPAPSNRLALAAAQEVAADPDTSYSPLFLSGPSGCGKTHLLHAIAREAARVHARAVLAPADHFLADFTTAVRSHSTPAFRAKYRDVDLLLIDDVHQLSGKKATQQELFQTVAVLHDSGRRVVLAGDLAAFPCDASSRLHACLASGLIAAIDPPALEERLQFVRSKAAATRATLPLEVIQYVAIRAKASFRDLDGAVNRVLALARISDEPLSIDLAARALQGVAAPRRRPPPPPSHVVDAVCRRFQLTPACLSSPSRSRQRSYARQLAMYLLREDCGLTYKSIALLFSRKDHSTVIHACSQVASQLGLSPETRADIDAIRTDLSPLAESA
jgi:chromosomal replication initiator protein